MPSTIPYWQDYPVVLASINDIITFDAHGEWLACYLAGEEFEVSVESSPWLKFNQGLRMGWVESQRATVRVRAKVGAVTFPNQIVLRFGVGEYVDARFSVSAPLQLAPGAQFIPKVAVKLSSPGVDVALVADTNTAIFAANADAESVDVYNSGAVNVRLATATGELSGTRGLIIPPNTSRTVRTNGNLYARAIGGVATVSVNFTAFA